MTYIPKLQFYDLRTRSPNLVNENEGTIIAELSTRFNVSPESIELVRDSSNEKPILSIIRYA